MFEGFDSPLQNWSKLPHQMIEALPLINSLAEMKVVLYVLRHTWGFQEFEDWEAKCITTDEFENGRKRRDGTRLDNGIGMSAPSVYSGLERAVEHGFLVKYVDNTDLGRVTHYYRLRMERDDIGIVYASDPDRPGTSHWHTIDPEIKKFVYNRFQGRCAYCDKKSRKWHYDHIVPQAQGGPSDKDNLALACPQCNLSKNNRTPDEWGHQVVYYEDDVKKVYRGWERFISVTSKTSLHQNDTTLLNSFTPPSKEALYRSEKDTFEGNSQEETLIACETQARASTPSDLEHQTPAPDDSLPPESVEQEEPPVAISADCKDSIATIFTAEPPAPVAPDPPPAGPNKNAIRAQLEAHFCEKTKLPPPRNKTARDKKAAGALWWSPLRDIAELCEWDAARAEKLICLTVDHFRSSKLTIANPNSIVKTATAIITGNVPGVKMPHEKKLRKITLIHSDGTLEEVEEFV